MKTPTEKIGDLSSQPRPRLVGVGAGLAPRWSSTVNPGQRALFRWYAELKSPIIASANLETLACARAKTRRR